MTENHLNYIFGMHNTCTNVDVEAAEELPNETMEVKVSCTKSVDTNALGREAEVQDMTIGRDRNNRNVIVFVGIYADNDFDEHTILKVVRRFDKKASIFSVSPLK